jgi:hypothetical protein
MTRSADAIARSNRSSAANQEGAAWENDILATCQETHIRLTHIPPAVKIVGQAPARQGFTPDPRLKLCRLVASTSPDFTGFIPVTDGPPVPLAIEAKMSNLVGDTRSWSLPDRLRIRSDSEMRKDKPNGHQGRALADLCEWGGFGFVLLKLQIEGLNASGLPCLSSHVFLVPGLMEHLTVASWSREFLLPYRVPKGSTFIDVLDSYLAKIGKARNTAGWSEIEANPTNLRRVL